MQGVDLAQVMCRPIEKLIFRQSLQIVVGFQSVERRFSKAIDVLHRCKRLAFGDVNCAHLARPFINILKEIFVYVFAVIEVEVPRNRVSDRSRIARRRELALEGGERGRVSDAELVLEGLCAWNQLRIDCHTRKRRP